MAKSKRGDGKNKRTPTQRAVDIALIIELLMTCHTQDAVTAELNQRRKGQYKLSRPQVADDIKKAVAIITDRNCHNTFEERWLAAQRQLRIAAEALRCHGLSLRDQEKFISEKLEEKSRNEDGKLVTGRHKTRHEKIQTAGDKGYLAIAVTAIAEYSRLLGLYVQPMKDQLPEIPAGNQTNTFMFQVNIGGGGPSMADPHDKLKVIDDRRVAAAENQASTPAGGTISVKPSSTTVEGV